MNEDRIRTDWNNFTRKNWYSSIIFSYRILQDLQSTLNCKLNTMGHLACKFGSKRNLLISVIRINDNEKLAPAPFRRSAQFFLPSSLASVRFFESLFRCRHISIGNNGQNVTRKLQNFVQKIYTNSPRKKLKYSKSFRENMSKFTEK